MHTLLARNRKRVRHVRRFHVAELQRHVRESRRDRSDNDGLFIIHARPICSNNRENDVLFVQDVVVLEIVKERGWSQVRGAGQEYRRAWHNRRGLFLEAALEHVEWHFRAPGLVGQEVRLPRWGHYEVTIGH